MYFYSRNETDDYDERIKETEFADTRAYTIDIERI